MPRLITLTGLDAGAVTSDAENIRLRAEDADGPLHIVMPVENAPGVAELLIRLAHDAHAKSESDTHFGFVVDSVEMDETEDDHVALLRFWLGQTPFQFLVDEVALLELEKLAHAKLEAIRKSRA